MTRIIRLLSLAVLLALTAACSSLPPVSAKPANYIVAGQESRTFETQDQLTLFGQWWHPANGQPRAVVLLVHGTLVHSGFYSPWAKELTRKGYAVFGIDLRGWGQSQGYGRRGFVKSYDEYLEDMRFAWSEVQQRYPGLPVFVQGESLGGTVALLAQQSGTVQARGLILNAPAVRPNPGIGWVRAPSLIGKFNFWMASIPGRMFPNAPTLPASWLEKGISLVLEEPQAQRRFMQDPISTHTALPHAYVSSLYKGTARAQDGLGKITVPLIILHGTRDVMVPVSSSEYAMRKVGSADKKLQVYENMTHATLHDTEKGKVWFDIVEWLDQRTTAPVLASPSAAFDVRAWLDAQRQQAPARVGQGDAALADVL
jgi:acylglycerol lipase